ncbi:hypothetical protein ASA1KI_45270 [Opitutales bacterium ASA1]|uniref:hypothetical protein n=1 Tax=Congregicoccus parvus TaxID=3081749 RepID=UPI002B2D3AB7|nr:hypothetical protein ASA1KI_45270 [Opitutales bacterium ASA1]
MLYSLIVSYERRGKDPLADRPTRRPDGLPAMTNQNDLAGLTPANWRPAGAES